MVSWPNTLNISSNNTEHLLANVVYCSQVFSVSWPNTLNISLNNTELHDRQQHRLGHLLACAKLANAQRMFKCSENVQMFKWSNEVRRQGQGSNHGSSLSKASQCH